MTVDTQWEVSYKNEAALYLKKQTFIEAANSDAFYFPTGITHIAVYNSNETNITIYATISSQSDIEDDSANWIEWDGLSQFNPAITAIKAEATGAGTIEISARGTLS